MGASSLRALSRAVFSSGPSFPQNGAAHRSVTYYPGTPDFAAAWPIVIDGPTVQDGFDFFVNLE